MSVFEEKADGQIKKENLAAFRSEFDAEPRNELAMQVVTGSGLQSVKKREALADDTKHTYSVRIPRESKITNQKASGRCWLFAALNTMRIDMMDKYSLPDDFELSQPFMFFWDKFEKANFFLESILRTLDESEDSRIISHLVTAPVNDGGQYDMFVNIVEKYGVVPKQAYPESHSSSESRPLNWLVSHKLREFACTLRKSHKAGTSIDELRKTKETQMSEIYQTLVVALGKPPSKFDWTYHTKKENEHVRVTDLTPVRFAREYIPLQPADMVSLIHDPRNDYNELYTVDFLGNVVGGRRVLYINVDIALLKEYAIRVLQSGKPVWFGCDVGKFLDRSSGIMDPNLFAYDSLLGTQFNMTKEERLRYGDTAMTHAMVFTGVDMVDGHPQKWRVENSWGDGKGDKGYFMMTDAWFDEFMFQIVVDKSFLPNDILDILKKEPHVLSAWDPMGSLAE